MSELKRATLQMIADRAGVSKMTVSRVLRNHPNCGKETRKRVERIAKELNYKKHPLVSALMTDLRYKKKSAFKPIIALLHLDQPKRKLHPNLKNMRAGAKESAEAQGYDVEEFYMEEPGMTTKRMMQILKTRGIHGIIFEHSAQPDVSLEIDLSNYACVATKYSVTDPDLHRIETGQFHSILLSVKTLKRYGYKSFGLVVPVLAENISQFRRSGATLYVQEQFPESERIPILKTDDLKVYALKEWIERYRPEVVLSQSIEVYEMLQELGYRIPEDFGFIHLGLFEFDGKLAGINPNWHEMGRIAANQVIDQLNRNERGVPEHPLVTLIKGEWVDGATLPDKRKASPSNQRATATKA
ncbi:MAG: LacI family transcriptional regulator [Verrucomicrobiae bacterium]|nr:LacI family transcriptional regulator [Verrucomicrobiae bacterium]